MIASPSDSLPSDLSDEFAELIAELKANKANPAKPAKLSDGLMSAAGRARGRRPSCAYGNGIGALKYTGSW